MNETELAILDAEEEAKSRVTMLRHMRRLAEQEASSDNQVPLILLAKHKAQCLLEYLWCGDKVQPILDVFGGNIGMALGTCELHFGFGFGGDGGWPSLTFRNGHWLYTAGTHAIAIRGVTFNGKRFVARDGSPSESLVAGFLRAHQRLNLT